MPDPIPVAFSLATATVEAAFDLITRYTTSADSVGILELNRLVRELRKGSRSALPLAIRSLGTLGWASEFVAFRGAMDRLRHSLPPLCCLDVTASQASAAAEDLKQLALAATLLRAPDVAAGLAQIIHSVQKLKCLPDTKAVDAEPKDPYARRPIALH